MRTASIKIPAGDLLMGKKTPVPIENQRGFANLD